MFRKLAPSAAWSRFLVATFIDLAATIPASAVTAVLNDGGGPPAGHTNFDDAGWQFITTAPVSITALGLFANGGLVQSHQVSIYSTAGVLQTSVVVPTGLTPDAQGYVYANLGTPFLLQSGTWLILASYAKSSPDRMRVGANGTGSSVVVSAPLTFNGAFVYSNSFTPVDPNNPAPGNNSFGPAASSAAFFGPNFQFTVAPVTPAPSSILLVGIGLTLLLSWHFVRRSAAARHSS